ncbi:regulatory protein RecX [Stigmatella sp. ncwal1]|uniref:Regulatory protein RecX n=1 Tax=Stigmatella ashevillensis TaxID=2995309 RepID=A0ABT5DQ17_9BACT|nr:regulatory protein RecX [Stigmatella ashevillena]MDC0714466.1 regulatory protein RecX [Stigmatella ashevillena]
MTTEADGPEEVQRATDACLRLLAMRARSQQELRLALQRKGFSEAIQEQALEKLKGYGYLDDKRFAQDRAASLLSRGRLGPQAVLQRLQAHGLEAEVAREAVSSAAGAVAFDALAAARHVLERRGLLGRPLEPKEQARAGRLLHSRGFSADVIRQLLGDPSLDPSGLDD